MSIQTYPISFSFEQPNGLLDSLLRVLQQALNSPKARSPRVMSLLRSRNVLIIDGYEQRAGYIAQLLTAAAYRPLAATPLDAFTLFLQGSFIPFAVVMAQEDPNQRLFLARLAQQIMQKYDWEVPLIRLLSQPQFSNRFLSQTTAPLPRLQSPDRPPFPTTRPLPPAQQPGPFSPPTTAPLPPLRPSPTVTIATNEPVQQKGLEKKEAPKLSLEGESLGRYQVHTLLGGGSQCTVYHTYDRFREQDVALKAIPSSILPYQINEGSTEVPNFFQPELDLLASLDHPHILPIANIGKSYISGQPFFYKTTSYCSEGSLDRWCAQRTSRLFSPQEVMPIVMQLADALQYVHERQVIYQNFKLSNLLVRNQAQDMRGLHVVLVDFAFAHDGICFARAPANFRYMAPEQFADQSLPASDQYSLAAVTYELLTGRPPFQGHAEPIMKRMHTQMQPQPPSSFNPGISPYVNQVILRALAKMPGDRFASVSEFASTLQRSCK